MTLREKQLEIENEQRNIASNKIVNDFNKAKEQGRLDETAGGQVLMTLGLDIFTKKIEEYLESPLSGTRIKDRNLFLLMSSDDVRETAYIVMRNIIGVSSMNRNIGVVKVAENIMKELNHSFLLNNLSKENPKLYSYLGQEYRRASKRRKDALLKKHLQSLKFINEVNLHRKELVRIGTMLIELYVKSGVNIITINKMKLGRHNKYVVRLTDEAIDILTNSMYARDMFNKTRMKPMIVEPNDWEEYNKGGYLTHQINFVKVKDTEGRKFVEKQDYKDSMEVINKLQKTKWRVNRRVTDIIYDMFTESIVDPKSPEISQTSFGGLPLKFGKSVKDIVGTFDYDETSEENKREWVKWNKNREKVIIENDANISRRLSFNYTLGIAQELYDYEYFYYVYQLDTRGRIYTHNDSFNPQSTSYIKSMLEFGEGQKLTDRGYYWLKIHTANVYGLDKEKFEDRIIWFDKNIKKILEVDNDYQDDIEYWSLSDSPYEFLASCFAVGDYHRNEKVYLPIQLDAINSGVQMYSGLVMDKEGAENTGVINFSKDGEIVRPDLYKLVAERVNDKIMKGDYIKEFQVKMKDNTYKEVSTKKEADSMKPHFDIIEVEDDYILKEGEYEYE